MTHEGGHRGKINRLQIQEISAGTRSVQKTTIHRKLGTQRLESTKPTIHSATSTQTKDKGAPALPKHRPDRFAHGVSRRQQGVPALGGWNRNSCHSSEFQDYFA